MLLRFGWVFAGVFILAVIWVGAREKRKGDFAFRIRKLQMRSADLVSALMRLEGESEYLALLQGTPQEREAREARRRLDEANERAVAVSEALKTLMRRARSWTDFSDLYVDIGEQEEKLEQAEALLREVTDVMERLSGAASGS